MNKFYELHEILNSLVEAWPHDQQHPTVEQARNYLQDMVPSSSDYSMDIQPYITENEDYYNAMWYSL